MVTESFAPSPSEVSAARHFAQAQAESLGCDSADLGLIVSELATNACVHAGSAFTVSLNRQGSDVLVEVGDQNPAPAVVQPQSIGRVRPRTTDRRGDRGGLGRGQSSSG